VVHAILFYSPTCPHCHQVINEELIPLQEQYGDRLVLLGFDTSQPWANDLLFEAIQYHDVPEERWAVPFLVVGDEALIGAEEIPARFPSIIQDGLAGEGIDIPNIPGIVTFLREQGVIDPRYPERRVAVQAHAEDEAGAAPDSAPPAGVQENRAEGDTVSIDSLAPAGEVAQDPDTAGAEAPTADTAEGRGVAPTDDPVSGEELRAGPDSTPPPTGDREASPAADRLPQAGAPGLDPDSVARGTDEARSDSAGPLGEPAGDSAGAADSSLNPGARGRGPAPLDLQAVARELEDMGMWDRFRLDPVGNSFSVLVLLFLAWTLLVRGYPPRVRSGPWPEWAIPCLLALGAAVALYLTYVEVTGSPAVCGPVGDCNTVQQSSYARLFGVLPVGILGLVGYLLMFAFWGWGMTGASERRRVARRLLWGSALIGTLFSLYLTFLEPFFIGATCAWCLTSAVVMALLLWASAPLAALEWAATPSGAE
jgi:uncharacterized membrane protein